MTIQVSGSAALAATQHLLSRSLTLIAVLLTVVGAIPAADATTTTTSTFTTTKTIRTITTTIPGGQPTMTIGARGGGSYSGSEFKHAIVNSTNYFRAQYQAQALIWDDKLAEFGQHYADQCQWKHSGGPYGENLAEGFGTPALAIDAWAAEERKYNWGNEHFSEGTGHFTQLVWNNTRKVGCGAANCTNAGGSAFGLYLVCEYDPPGNVQGAFKQNVHKAGEGKGGNPGFGAASKTTKSSSLLAALVAVSFLVRMSV